MDLSKAFDCLPHDLLIAKLKAYGVKKKSLKLILDYLTNRKQRVKIGSSLSFWLKILAGVPQGSILGPILFNIFINDFLFSLKHSQICNFADDNSIYACENDIENVLRSLNNDIQISLQWFKTNFMVANPAKFQVIFPGSDSTQLGLYIENKFISATSSVKLLGITIDSKLSFTNHITDICTKANLKTKALLRIRNYLSEKQAQILCNSFILSYFNYCPVVWMFSNKTLNNLVNKTYTRALRALLNNFTLTSQEILEVTKRKTIHCHNLQKLAIEVFKSVNNLNPNMMCDLFEFKNSVYNLRRSNLIALPQSLDTNSWIFRGILLWNNLENEIKSNTSTDGFKNSVKNMNLYCQCKICH